MTALSSIEATGRVPAATDGRDRRAGDHRHRGARGLQVVRRAGPASTVASGRLSAARSPHAAHSDTHQAASLDSLLAIAQGGELLQC